MKTAELTGAELDYWVARAEGYTFGKQHGQTHEDGTRLFPFHAPGWKALGAVMRLPDGTWSKNMPRFSTDWSQGGPIIERERIILSPEYEGEWHAAAYGDAEDQPTIFYDASPLIAAMRAYIASKFGEEVEDTANLSLPLPAAE